MNVKEFFKEVLSGEPLTQDAVEEALLIFGLKLLNNHIEHPQRPGYKRKDIIDSIKNLKPQLRELIKNEKYEG